MLESIKDFVLGVFSIVFQMDLSDHHNIPFAMPLVAASFTGFFIGFLILRLIGNEERERNKKLEQKSVEY